MTVTAIVLQNALAASKSRLAPLVGPADRTKLALGLLRHVCTVLRTLPAIEAVSVMTPDPQVRARAARWGVASIPDPTPDLNASLALAAAALEGGRGILILAADLPILEPADVAALLARTAPRVVVLGPSKDGAGTNALLLPPGARFRPAYGPGSRAAHRREAAARGLAVVEVVRPGLAYDLDTPADLFALPSPERLTALQNHG